MLPKSTRRGTSTVEDLYRIPEEERYHELLGGEIVRRGAPTSSHGFASAALAGLLGPFSKRRGDGDGGAPGGWWLAYDVDMRFGDDVCRPDLIGWRRDRVPKLPTGMPVTERPDWVCEVLSTNRRNDLVRKMRIYHRERIPHYWVLDPDEKTLMVFRWQEDGYLEVLSAEAGETVRAEPFDAIELAVGSLFGDE